MHARTFTFCLIAFTFLTGCQSPMVNQGNPEQTDLAKKTLKVGQSRTTVNHTLGTSPLHHPLKNIQQIYLSTTQSNGKLSGSLVAANFKTGKVSKVTHRSLA